MLNKSKKCGCPMWDELNNDCQWNRMEVIVQMDCEKSGSLGNFEECFSEFD